MFYEDGEVPEWSKGADCKSVGYAFEGSNPSLPRVRLLKCYLKKPLSLIRRAFIPVAMLQR
jgi:hypothetical protein